MILEGFVQSSTSVVLLTIVLAIIPTAAWLGFYYWQYRRLSVPVLMTLGVFGMGIVAVFMSLLIQRPLLGLLSPVTRQFLSGQLVDLTSMEALRAFVLAFLIAAPSEEITKMIGVLVIAYPSNKFTRNFDGIVMGIAAGLGFALAENIVYFFPLVASGQVPVLIGSFVLRFLVSTVAHSLYSGVAAFYIAKAKLTPGRRLLYFSLAFLVPWVMHGLFNFFLFTRVVYYALVLVAVAMFLLLRVRRNRRNLEVKMQRGKVLSNPFFKDEEFADQQFKARGYFHQTGEASIAGYKEHEVYGICPQCFTENKTHSNFCVNCHENLLKKKE